MDVFKEQNVLRLSNSNDTAKKILITVAAVCFATGVFVLTFGSLFMMIGIIIAGGVMYGGYYLVTSMYVEYEYIITNGEVDFDKIIAQRSRKRLCTVKLSTATAFGVADDNADTDNADTYVVATANDPEMTDYFLRVKHKSLGDTVVFFNPDDEMIELIKQFLPRSLRA
ncbi:hypothetical protein SAMN02910317_00830 [Ruminococcaceae bacterium FB2012]|nr:hypothetical protein SAMN02910317_00830 [Ruminococcaceae bacterium FB2012]